MIMYSSCVHDHVLAFYMNTLSFPVDIEYGILFFFK
jgi:hypothetical protein